MKTLRSATLVALVAATFAAAGCDDADAPGRTPNADPVVEGHIQVVLQRIAANNAKDWAKWESLHVPGAVRTAPELPEPLVGASAMRAGIEELVTAFPDYTLQLVEAFGQGNRLMARIHAKGTMQGPIDIGGTLVPPTGKTFEQDWVGVLTFEGDKIAAIDEFHDNYTLLIQLGLAE